MSKNHRKAKEFLEISGQFQLGDLPTEWPHPKTKLLSHWANRELSKGLEVLKSIDSEALELVEKVLPQLQALRGHAQKVLTKGGRIFLCGCGATGRLSLTLESLWRRENPQSEQIISFMAGGDVALVHAIEGFEDYPDYGIRHLDQLGFNPDDMLISCTEGGETPYVIGATTRAAQISKNPSYFLYCNPTETLTRNIERSRRIIATQGVESIEVFVGPMALAGSTRMQASTVLQLAVGLVLFSSSDIDLVANFKLFLKQHESLDYQALIPFIEREASTYLSGDRVLYSVEDFAITVFTDTTERAPTFNLPSFESSNSASGPSSYSYVCIPSTNTALASWEFLLSHGPRALNWEEVNSKTTDRYLHQFDFSQACAEARAQRIQPAKQRHFEVLHKNNQLYFSFDGVVQSWQLSERGPFYDHLLLKMLLNSHSTLMMGRLGRYVNNIMTWVKPTNNKLIDRAARYVLYLLAENQQTGVTYEQVIYELFQQMESMNCAESLVNRTCQALSHPLPR